MDVQNTEPTSVLLSFLRDISLQVETEIISNLISYNIIQLYAEARILLLVDLQTLLLLFSGN